MHESRPIWLTVWKSARRRIGSNTGVAKVPPLSLHNINGRTRHCEASQYSPYFEQHKWQKKSSEASLSLFRTQIDMYNFLKELPFNYLLRCSCALRNRGYDVMQPTWIPMKEWIRVSSVCTRVVHLLPGGTTSDAVSHWVVRRKKPDPSEASEESLAGIPTRAGS